MKVFKSRIIMCARQIALTTFKVNIKYSLFLSNLINLTMSILNDVRVGGILHPFVTSGLRGRMLLALPLISIICK